MVRPVKGHRGTPGQIVDHAVRAPESIRLAQIQITPSPPQQTIVNGDRMRGVMPAEEVRHLAAALPRRVQREGQYLDRTRVAIKGIPGVEEARLSRRRQQHPHVGDPRNLVVDQRMHRTHRRHRQFAECRCAGVRLTFHPQLRKDRHAHRIAQHSGIGIGSHQVDDALGVEVIRVLVSDENGIEIADGAETISEVPRVDQDPLVGHLQQQAGVAQMSDSHGITVGRGRAGSGGSRTPIPGVGCRCRSRTL